MTEEVLVEAPKRDFYLKLTAESDMPTVLSDFYSTDEDENSYLVQFTPDYAIDVVGVIHEPTGVTLQDADGNDYNQTAPVDGWHVNIRLVGDAMRETVEALDATHGVTPNSPSRIWL
jgi:hypothetical protein